MVVPNKFLLNVRYFEEERLIDDDPKIYRDLKENAEIRFKMAPKRKNVEKIQLIKKAQGCYEANLFCNGQIATRCLKKS
jgi:hypothetical protein